jgi:hypothetical protein
MPNLGTSGRRQRLVVAVAMLLVAVAGWILLRDRPGLPRAVLFLPIFLGLLSALQAQTST